MRRDQNQRMRRWLTCALVLAALSMWQTRAGTTDQDCLQRFLQGVSNKGILATNWSDPNFPCAAPFIGITCYPGTLQVWKLQLSNFGLVATLPPELALCSFLSELDLSKNILTGTMPAELGGLSNLVSLDLSDSSLQGPIPAELGRCVLLEHLDLEGNQLTGSVPAELASLDKLASLRLASNDLSGPIPSGLARRPDGGVRFNSTSFRPGNRGLSGQPLSLPPARRGISVLEIVFIGLASGFISLIISFAAVCVWMRHSDAKKFTSFSENM